MNLNSAKEIWYWIVSFSCCRTFELGKMFWTICEMRRDCVIIFRLIVIVYPSPNSFSCDSVPKHFSYPLTIIPILSHNYSASDIVWVVRTVEVFLILITALRIFHKFCLETGSSPVDGSSKNRIFGALTKAIATHNLRLFPPERCFAYLFLYSSSFRPFMI